MSIDFSYFDKIANEISIKVDSDNAYELILLKAIKDIKHQYKNEIYTSEFQSHSMKYWWKNLGTYFNSANFDYCLPKEKKEILTLFEWKKSIDNNKKELFLNINFPFEHNIPWVQFALMAHWTFLKTFSSHIPKSAWNVKNSSGHTSFHILAITALTRRTEDFNLIFTEMKKKSKFNVLEKDNSGKTALELLEDFALINKTLPFKYIETVRNSFKKEEAFLLNEELQNSLTDSNSIKNTAKMKI